MVQFGDRFDTALCLVRDIKKGKYRIRDNQDFDLSDSERRIEEEIMDKKKSDRLKRLKQTAIDTNQLGLFQSGQPTFHNNQIGLSPN